MKPVWPSVAEKPPMGSEVAAARPGVALRSLHAFVSIVHNPYVNCGALFVLAVYVHGLQWLHWGADTVPELSQIAYVFDACSNAINLLFVVRFCFGVFWVPFEVAFAVAQLVYVVVYVLREFLWVYVLYDFFDLVCVIQVVIPVLLNLINIYELVVEGNSLAGFLIAFNNNFIPLLISNSFIFINLSYPLFSAQPWIVEAFIYALISLKFFCLYQYIMYELGVVQPAHSFKHYLLALTCVFLVAIDLYFACLFPDTLH